MSTFCTLFSKKQGNDLPYFGVFQQPKVFLPYVQSHKRQRTQEYYSCCMNESSADNAVLYNGLVEKANKERASGNETLADHYDRLALSLTGMADSLPDIIAE